jgi:hypothetical protein
MKKIKTILLLLVTTFMSLTFTCKSQTFLITDRVWNVEASLDGYSGVYEPHYTNDVSLESYTVSTNEITLDTVLGTLSVTFRSEEPTDSIYWNLNIVTVNYVGGSGVTYNFQDYTSGSYGLLFIESDGTILFLLEKSLSLNEYFGFLGSVESVVEYGCWTD